MNKLLIAIIASSLLLTSCGSDHGNSGDNSDAISPDDTLIMTRSIDAGANGTVDIIDTRTYDANGNLLSESRDHDADGTTDSLTTYTYDTDGNVLTATDDYYVDGKIDRISTYTYDTDGNVWTVTYDDYVDGKTDGTIDGIRTYSHDKDSNTVIRTRDYYADGTIDVIVTSIYDANGNLLSVEREDSSDYSDSFWTYTNTYGTNGKILERAIDLNSDGIVDEIVTFTYEGNLQIEIQSWPIL